MRKIINDRIRRRNDGDDGFTLVELLVVVVIIGILVAIAIPVFLNQREGAWESAVESDLRNAAPAAETYFAGNGTYVGLTDANMLFTDGVTSIMANWVLTSSTYCIEATHTNLGERVFSLNSATGLVAETPCV